MNTVRHSAATIVSAVLGSEEQADLASHMAHSAATQQRSYNKVMRDAKSARSSNILQEIFTSERISKDALKGATLGEYRFMQFIWGYVLYFWFACKFR